MSIIAINGLIGSGKDAIGKMIQYINSHNVGDVSIQQALDDYKHHEQWLEEQSGWEIKKFAGKLKQIASLLTGIPVEKFEDQEFKKTFLSSEWGTIKDNPLNVIPAFEYVQFNELMSVREFLQKLGTEAMRNGLHTNVWVNALFADYVPNWKFEGEGIEIDDVSLIKAYPNWIITDMRFPNEMEAVKERGGITVNVIRPGISPGTHESDFALVGAKFDYEIINDGSIEQLFEKVYKFVKEKL
jgi:hypothetical protein